MPKTTWTPKSVIHKASQLFRKRFTKAEWTAHPDRPVSASTILNWFGSWTAFLNQIEFKTTHLDEVIEWSQAAYPEGTTRVEWDSNPNRPVHSDTIQQWVGWNEFLRRTYGSSARISPNASDDDVREWIRNSTGRNDRDCWTSSSTGSGGYGRITRNGKIRALHIVAYELFNGPIPEGHVVRHTCDDPACCNPEHLITGTRSQNALDYSDRKNWTRTPRIGFKRPANLSDQQIIDWLWSNKRYDKGCWLHHSPHPSSGYGTIRVRGVMWQAHRFIRCHLDGLPKDHPMIVRHTCGNRACINPDHLVWGSLAENRQDDILAGKNVKVPPETRRKIREAWKTWTGGKSEFDRKHAKLLGVSTGTIRNIRVG